MAGGYTDRGHHWIDSVHQQSFLPHQEWDEVQNVLGYALARLIHQDFPSLSPGERSALFHLLGRRFFETFMQSCKIEFVFDVDHKILHDMKCYVEDLLKQALKDSKFDETSLESRPLENFRKQLQRLYQKLLVDTLQGEYKKTHEHHGLFDHQLEKARDTKFETLLTETFNNPSITSNVIGEGINHILQRQPNLFDKVCFKLKGRQLPPALRKTIWTWTLVSQNGKLKYASEELVWEEFQQHLALKMAQLKIKTSTSSPMRGLIKMMILEKFKSTPCLQSLVKTSVSSVVEDAMNIYNVCFGKCDPVSIFLLFPLHMGFMGDHADDKFPYSLALYLSLLELYVIPNPQEVDAIIIQHVEEKIEQYDEVLDSHLKSIFTQNKSLSHPEGSPSHQGTDHTGIGFLLQQWIKAVFVGILSKPAVMFVWDQLFLQKWKPKVIRDFCLCLIFLLRENLLTDAKDFPSLMKVLSEEPSRLFTMDIQSAYQYVSEGNDMSLVWKFNRKTRKGYGSSLDNGPTAPEDGLDFYIDGIRFLPDNTTITKVTGHLITPFLDVPDLLALPDLNSDAKSPTYSYRYSLESVERSNLILLRIFTVDPQTKNVAIVGSSVMALCEEVDGQPRVKCGSFQLRVKQGLPKNLSHLTEELFNEFPSVPGCSVLVRIQPRSEAFTERPPYHTDYPYMFPLSESEQEVLGRIISATSPGETEREVALSLRETEGAGHELTDEDLTEWLSDRLDKENPLLDGKPAEQIQSSSMFYYNPKTGVKVKVLRGLGFKDENLYTGALVRTLPGDSVEPGLEGSQGQSFLAATVDLESSVMGPRWTQEAVLCHPSYGENHLLFVEIAGVNVTLKRSHSDQSLSFGMEKLSNLAWTVVPLFEGKFVAQGRHILPLFQHGDKSILERFTNEDYLAVFQDAMKSGKVVLSTKCLFVEVEVFDGRFEYKDITPLQERTDLLVLAGQLNAFKTVNEMTQQGTHLSLLLNGRKSEGLTDAEKLRIQKTASKIFQDAVYAVL